MAREGNMNKSTHKEKIVNTGVQVLIRINILNINVRKYLTDVNVLLCMQDYKLNKKPCQ